MSDFEDDASFEPGSRKKRNPCLVFIVVVALLGACCISYIMINVFEYPIRRRLATYDVRLTLKVEAASERSAVATVCGRRLRRARILGSVRHGAQPDEVEVDVKIEDVEEAKRLLVRSGRLRFMIVVGDELSRREQQAEIARVRQAKANGSYDPFSDPYDALPGPRPEEPLLLRRTELWGTDISEVYPAYDNRGRKCLGFTMSPTGRRKFFDLTDDNVGRRLAIVFEGEVLSAPVIRGPIGKRGIIEGGGEGFDEAELDSLIGILQGGELPCDVELKQERDLGN